MSMFKYWGFGLYIAAEIPFPELFPLSFSEQPDVTICLGEIPFITGNHTFCTGRITYTMTDREMVFTVKDIGSYYISGGDTIIICPDHAGIEPRFLHTFVLSAAMPAILQQRRTIALHAAAIIHNGHLTCIAGHSGAGKSTTLAGLIEQQYQVFSDDVTVLSAQCQGIASYPMIKLWEQSMQTLDNDTFSDRSFPILPGIEKYGVFFHEHFDTNTYPISTLILLKLSEDNQFRTQQLSGGDAFVAMVEHIYKNSFYNTPDMRMFRFQTISQLLQRTAVYQVARPAGCHPEDLIARVTDLI